MSGIKNDFRRVSTLTHDVFLIAIKKIRTRLPNFLYCLRQPSSANPVWNPLSLAKIPSVLTKNRLITLLPW